MRHEYPSHPIVDAEAAIVEDVRLLIVKEKVELGSDKWSILGLQLILEKNYETVGRIFRCGEALSLNATILASSTSLCIK